jgi:hypothetical protein
MKYPYDDNEENKNPDLYIAKSFSLQRKLIAAIRVRARALGISMSAYVATLVRNDLARAGEAPLSILSDPDAQQVTPPPSPSLQQPRGIVVPEFEL